MALNTYFPIVPSGLTRGKLLKITGTDSSGADTVHTATASSSDFDYLSLYVINKDTSDVTLYLLWGGTGADDTTPIPIQPGKVDFLFISEKLIQGGSSDVIKIYASVANKLFISSGFSYRITTP